MKLTFSTESMIKLPCCNISDSGKEKWSGQYIFWIRYNIGAGGIIFLRLEQILQIVHSHAREAKEQIRQKGARRWKCRRWLVLLSVHTKNWTTMAWDVKILTSQQTKMQYGAIHKHINVVYDDLIFLIKIPNGEMTYEI